VKPIPRRTIYRLSVYLRSLQRLQESHAASSGLTVSSDALAKAAGVKPTQLRKDLTHLGPLGKRGLGYQVDDLIQKLSTFLGMNRLQPVIVVGVGNFGTALLCYKGFEKAGFEIVGAFDVDPSRPRSSEIPVSVRPMSDIPSVVKDRAVKMAILTVPGTSAQEVANLLIESGITAILNFAPVILLTPESVIVNNVNLAIELENLAYFVQ
jgi:redox-sensing transcriptional repressor